MDCAKPPGACRAMIALGSNLADPVQQVRRGFDALAALPQTRLIARSSLYRTAPLGVAEQPDYINAVAGIETGLAPRELLDALLEIERRHGRVREAYNAPRTLDLDLLLYAGLECHEHGLTLPHPRMHERAFVLRPLLEIAPDCRIPGRGAAADWLAHCAGQRVELLAAAAQAG